MPLLSHDLRKTNQRLHLLMDNVSAQQEQARAVSPQVMSALLSELLAVGVKLRQPETPGAISDREDLARELEEYRCHIERLRDLLPAIQQHLLAERARIESERLRLQSAARWARASREVLEATPAQRR